MFKNEIYTLDDFKIPCITFLQEKNTEQFIICVI